VSGIGPGDVVAGKYRVERVLGEGGMGYVVAARHLQLGQMVALKFMRAEVCTREYRGRFTREARAIVRLKSKHVSRVIDVGELEGGSPYMVMEYLEGTDLSDLLHKRGPFPVQDACEFILQACEAIAEAHGLGIVHRDLKPANLFLTKGQSGEPVVKVLDFGVSKVIELGIEDDTNPGGRPRQKPADSVVTRASDLLGSPSYMAPEQIISARDADIRSDIWSLGVILFRLISGKAPFHATSLGELIQAIVHGPIPSLRDAKPDLPQGLEHVVARCLERDRNNRLGDVTELARMLAPYAGPVAAPSLERIAILGPALVASVPPPQPSVPSYNSAARSAWTSPPMSGGTNPGDTNEMSSRTAALWGGVFVGALAVSAFLVVTVLGHRTSPPVVEPATATAATAPAAPLPDPNSMPAIVPPTVVESLDPSANAAPAPGVATAAPAAPAAPRASTHAQGGGHRPRGTQPPRGSAETKPTAPAATTPDIPATRE
jgi:serine/threonine-protein kinase